MPSNLEYDQITSWPNANQHVDASIGDGSKFTNAAHTIIYVKVTDADAPFRPIGVIQGWSLTEQRQVEEVFELGSDVRYIVPGRTTGQIAITRLLVNGSDLANTLYGTFDENGNLVSSAPIRSLKDINRPVDFVFVSYNNDTNTTEHMVRYFTNCWIIARQESITANQVTVAENCTITFERIDSTVISTPDLS